MGKPLACELEHPRARVHRDDPGARAFRDVVRKLAFAAAGRRLMILYWPDPSLTTERTFSINAGLAASTVTPGSTPPDASLTTPAIELV